MKNEEIKKELLDLSQTLADLPKVELKQVPDGYFDGLPNATWDKISSTQGDLLTPKTNVIPLIRKVAGIAASFALLFFVIRSMDTVQPADQISTDAMIEYLIEDLGPFDEDFLLELDLESSELAELNDESIDYILDEEIELIDDKILETLY